VPSAVLEKEKEKATGGVFAVRFSWSEALDIAAEIYHGYVFWTILTSLGLVVWCELADNWKRSCAWF
jgi:hypothetical protein